jgi:MoxR-like ATPase
VGRRDERNREWLTDMFDYRKTFFDPASLRGFTLAPSDEREDWAYDAGSRVDPTQRHFVFAEEAILALNVALATRRPLLISGEPGSGKTLLARFAALALGYVFYRETITSRTQASDLLSSFDALRRLGDAQIENGLKPTQAYVVPGKLWWALNPQTAGWRGRAALPDIPALDDPGMKPAEGDGSKAALLLDEIDKADPDVPNDLLEALDERGFNVPETGDRIAPERADLLIMLTTNGERELPPAFLRRCVTLELPKPTEGWLVDIAKLRFGAGDGAFKADLYSRLAGEVMRLRQDAEEQGRRPPSTSEFVDAVACCRELLKEDRFDEDPAKLASLLEVVLTKKAAQRSTLGS